MVLRKWVAYVHLHADDATQSAIDRHKKVSAHPELSGFPEFQCDGGAVTQASPHQLKESGALFQRKAQALGTWSQYLDSF